MNLSLLSILLVHLHSLNFSSYVVYNNHRMGLKRNEDPCGSGSTTFTTSSTESGCVESNLLTGDVSPQGTGVHGPSNVGYFREVSAYGTS